MTHKKLFNILCMAALAVSVLMTAGCGSLYADMGTPDVVINGQIYTYRGEIDEFLSLPELPDSYSRLDEQENKIEYSHYLNADSEVWAEQDQDDSVYVYTADFLGPGKAKYYLFVRAGLPLKIVRLDAGLYSADTVDVTEQPDLAGYQPIGSISSYNRTRVPDKPFTANSKQLLDGEVYYRDETDDLYIRILSQDDYNGKYVYMTKYEEE
ncbi:MAG: hypothetical protein J1E39_05145 [Eubacterium sp.]|nr:hypothetical protein [Eubacterium sp.]